MAITYDQFKLVLSNRTARTELGLDLTDERVVELQANEARAIAFYELWSQKPAPVSIVPPAVVPWSTPAIVGFILSLLAALTPLAGLAPAAFVLAIVALILSAVTEAAIDDGSKRGHGLTIAGAVISLVAIVGIFAYYLVLLKP